MLSFSLSSRSVQQLPCFLFWLQCSSILEKNWTGELCTQLIPSLLTIGAHTNAWCDAPSSHLHVTVQKWFSCKLAFPGASLQLSLPPYLGTLFLLLEPIPKRCTYVHLPIFSLFTSVLSTIPGLGGIAWLWELAHSLRGVNGFFGQKQSPGRRAQVSALYNAWAGKKQEMGFVTTRVCLLGKRHRT